MSTLPFGWAAARPSFPADTPPRRRTAQLAQRSRPQRSRDERRRYPAWIVVRSPVIRPNSKPAARESSRAARALPTKGNALRMRHDMRPQHRRHGAPLRAINLLQRQTAGAWEWQPAVQAVGARYKCSRSCLGAWTPTHTRPLAEYNVSTLEILDTRSDLECKRSRLAMSIFCSPAHSVVEIGEACDCVCTACVTQ